MQKMLHGSQSKRGFSGKLPGMKSQPFYFYALLTLALVACPSAPDTTPDAFSFAEKTNAEPNMPIVSQEIVVAGTTGPASIAVTGGRYSINGAAFSSATSEVVPNAKVRLEVNSNNFLQINSGELSIGGVKSIFKVTSRAADTTPDAMVFTAKTGAEPNAIAESNEVIISGLEPNLITDITVTGGEYSLNGNSYTNAPGKIKNGDKLKLRQTTSPNFLSSKTTNLSIGTTTPIFAVTTRDADNTPDPIVFIAKTGAEPNTTTESNEVTVTGLEANYQTDVSVMGGEYSLNAGPYTNAAGKIKNGDKIKLRQTASPNFFTNSTCKFSIGSSAAEFGITTRNIKSTPDAIAFGSLTQQTSNTDIESVMQKISGFDGQLPISIVGGKYALSTDGVTFAAFTDQASSVSANQYVKLLLHTATSNNTITSATLTVGVVASKFELTTKTLVADTVPDAFTFGTLNNQEPSTLIESSAITIAGINTAANISVDNVGTYALENPSGVFSFTAAAGKINPGQRVKVRLNSSNKFNDTTKTVLNIGGVTGTFTLVTREADQIPDALVFAPALNAMPNTSPNSNELVVSGLETNYISTPISITGGEYSLNNGAWTSAAGTIKNNDKIKVRVSFLQEFNLTKTATISLGAPNATPVNGTTASFSATTQTEDKIPDAFDFTDKTNAVKNTPVESDAVLITGFNSTTTASIGSNTFNAAMSVSSDGGTTWSAYAPGPINILPNNKLKLRLLASSVPNEKRSISLDIGGTSDSFAVTTAPPSDTDPDVFTIPAITGAMANTNVESATIKPTGFDAPTNISIFGGEYAIMAAGTNTFAAWTIAAGTINPGDSLKVRLTSGAINSVTNSTITMGTVSSTFSVKAGNNVPNAFVFTPLNNAPTNATLESNIISPSGFDVPTTVAVSGGEYAIEAVGATTFGPWANTAGTLKPGESIKVRLTTSPNTGTSSEVALNLGGTIGKFVVTVAGTPPVGNTSITYVIPGMVDATANTVVYSDDVLIDGIPTGGATFAVTGGEMSVNNGAGFGAYSSSGTIENNNLLKVRLTTNPTAGGNASASVVVGGITRKFIVVTTGGDVTPNNFSVPARTYCEGLQLVQSGQDANAGTCDAANLVKIAPVTITGLGVPTPLTVKTGEFKINTGSWQAGTALVSNNDTISFRNTTKALADQYQYSNVAITLGTYKTSWDIHTRRLSNGLGNYSSVTFMNLNDISNATANQLVESNSITVAGLEAGAESFVFVIGDGAGPAEYAIDAGTGFGPWMSSATYTDTDGNERFLPGIVKNGYKIKVRLTASATVGGLRWLGLYVGGKGWEITDRFVVQTRNNRKANNLVFTNKIATPGSLVMSDEITLAGLDSSVSANVTGGTLYLNGVAQTTSATVQNGDKIKIETTASTNATTAIVQVGDGSSSFTALGANTLDLEPDAFAFLPLLPAPIDSSAESLSINVAGLGAGIVTPLNISGGEYSINGGAWTNVAGTTQNADSIKVRLPENIAPGSTDAIVKLSIGTRPSVEFKPTAGTFKIKLLNNAPLPIRPGLQGSEIRVSDGNGPETALGFTVPSTTSKITKLRVGLKIEHEYRADLRIYLRPPDAGRTALFDWVWADIPSGVDRYQIWFGKNMDVVFDDAATVAWKDATGCGSGNGIEGPCAGPIKPKELLSNYNARVPTGKWKIIVGDSTPSNTGQVQSAEMIFTVQ